jgi:hypothetical membrane protein
MNYRKAAGALLFIGSAQFIIGMVVAEAVYPGYSISQNFISDLGVGPAALIFNTSVFLLGLMVLASAYFINRAFGNRVVAALLGLTGAGAIGVGVFPENFEMIHMAVSLVAFAFAGLSAIAAYKLERSPLSYFSVVIGVISLSALLLFLTGIFLGLGQGGMERMIVYPVLLWAISCGGYLMGYAPTAANGKSQAWP